MGGGRGRDVNAAYQPTLDFDAAEAANAAGEALIVDVDGFEGPLHVLLALARAQKVDLLKLSVAKLAEQYLGFVAEARRRRFSLAADYLVMAAWLAYLKSRLLLPTPAKATEAGPVPEEMARALAVRLARLDAIRRAGEALMNRPQAGRDVFARDDPDAITVIPSEAWETGLYDLVRAYADQRRKLAVRTYTPATPVAYASDEGREHLRTLLPRLGSWTSLNRLAPDEAGEGAPSRASYLAGTLSGGLELVKEGALEARQAAAFDEVWLRAREREAA